MRRILVTIFAAVALLANASFAANIRSSKTQDIDREKMHEEPIKHLDSKVVPKRRTLRRKLIAKIHPLNQTYYHVPGTILPLRCGGIGSPAPRIHWFRNNKPIYEFDVESNEVLDVNPSSLAVLNSTLLVKDTESKDEYTCVLVSGKKTDRTSTTVYRTDGVPDLPERTRLLPFEPHIVVLYEFLMDYIGTDITLPCKVKGHPKPAIIWYNNQGQQIQNDSKVNVLKSGDLVIKDLRWTDMGEFTCVATNIHGTAVASTFLYPFKPLQNT